MPEYSIKEKPGNGHPFYELRRDNFYCATFHEIGLAEQVRDLLNADKPDSVKQQRLAELEAEFEAAGGRGVELAEEIDALRAELDDDSATCKHCGRIITRENGAWVDNNATGDDAVWRETCDSHDTFSAEHEPATASGYEDMARRALHAGLTEGERGAAARLADALEPTASDPPVQATEPTRPPDELMARFLAGSRGEGDIDMMAVLWDILTDVRSSYRLAMENVDGWFVAPDAIDQVDGTVLDYLVNNYGEE